MNTIDKSLRRDVAMRRISGVSSDGADDIASALNTILADLFSLYVKTKNFHWHVAGPHFHDYHLLFDEQSAQVLATIDPAAERVRKLGKSTIRSVGQIARLQRSADNNEEAMTSAQMLTELLDDNGRLVGALREAHDLCDRHCDVATASLIENWIDEAEGRIWFLAAVVD